MATTTNGKSSKPNVLSTLSQPALMVASGAFISLIALLATNPGKPAYINYAAEKLPRELKKECSELRNDIHLRSIAAGPSISLPSQDLCHSFVTGADLVGRGATKLILDTSTKRKNLGIFSIYTTKLPGRTVKALGIGRNFFTFYYR
jgi:hypothetical protein